MSMGLEAILAQRTDIDLELRKNKSPVTVMFTDLAGSTAFFDQFGDTAGVQWIEEHNAIVFPEIEKHKGTVVKTIGDSVMAYFPDPVEAVHAGADILRAIHASNRQRQPKDKMYVRIALHHGLGYLRGGDIFGDVVNVAARLAKNCLPAQILVSEAVYLGAHETSSLEFRQMGSVQFRGKTSVENLFEVMWTDDQTYGDLRTLFPGKKASVLPKDEEFTGGRYAIQSELGRGAMGVVYKAYDRMIGRHVAMKTIPLEVDPSQMEALVARLKKEANTAGALDHPNIVTVYDVGDEGGVFYFTMQYVEGRTLSSLHEQKELLPLEKLCDICEQMIGAMAFAHQAGVIHRDLKPSNMMLTPKGQLKIMDFGIAKFGDSGLTRAGTILGTPSYLAPEQAAGRRVDNRADIFSLGAILYELFTGEKAFSGDSTTAILYKVMNENPVPPRALEPSLSPALNDVIMKALAKDPAHRYQDSTEGRPRRLSM
jgi:class 3 adenylate cyclase/predicted Ser/Thr protein kinase